MGDFLTQDLAIFYCIAVAETRTPNDSNAISLRSSNMFDTCDRSHATENRSRIYAHTGRILCCDKISQGLAIKNRPCAPGLRHLCQFSNLCNG